MSFFSPFSSTNEINTWSVGFKLRSSNSLLKVSPIEFPNSIIVPIRLVIIFMGITKFDEIFKDFHPSKHTKSRNFPETITMLFISKGDNQRLQSLTREKPAYFQPIIDRNRKK